MTKIIPIQPYLPKPPMQPSSRKSGPVNNGNSLKEQESIENPFFKQILSRLDGLTTPSVKRVELIRKADNENITADIFKTTKLGRILKHNEQVLGTMDCVVHNSEILGDAYPDYYKGKKYVYIKSPLLGNEKYKGVGTELVKEATRMSKKNGTGRPGLCYSFSN